MKAVLQSLAMVRVLTALILTLVYTGCGTSGGRSQNPVSAAGGGNSLAGYYIIQPAKADYDKAATKNAFCADLANHTVAHGVDFGQRVSLKQPYVIYGDVLEIDKSGNVYHYGSSTDERNPRRLLGQLAANDRFTLTLNPDSPTRFDQVSSNRLSDSLFVRSDTDTNLLQVSLDSNWSHKWYVSISKAEADAYFREVDGCNQVGLYQADYGTDRKRYPPPSVGTDDSDE